MTDQRMDEIISKLLRGGVSLAAAVVFIGGAWYVASARTLPDYGRFRPDLRGLAAFAHLDGPEKVIAAGLLLLILTPIARVAFSMAAFAVERDRMYVWFTIVVLTVLLYSIATAIW